jgi:hypothetical protein
MNKVNEISHPPSGYKVEVALSAWHAARARLLAEDPDLEHDEAALIDLLGPEEGDVQDVLTRLLRGAVHAETMAQAAAERAAAIKAREKRYTNRAQSMRGTALAILDDTGIRKLELEDLTASVTSGREKPEITDLDAIPELYVVTETVRKPDLRTILAVLKSGAAVPGCELVTSLPGLTIRTK